MLEKVQAPQLEKLSKISLQCAVHSRHLPPPTRIFKNGSLTRSIKDRQAIMKLYGLRKIPRKLNKAEIILDFSCRF